MLAGQSEEGFGLLEVRRVPCAVDHLEARRGQARSHESGALRPDRVEGTCDDERRAADGREPGVQRRHDALAGTPQRGRQATRVMGEALGAQATPHVVGQGRLAGEERLCFPGLDERGQAVSLELPRERVVGHAAPGSLGPVGDAG